MKGKLHEKTLVINHVLYFTPEQRLALVRDRVPAQVIGVSMPIWFNQGKSNEPGHEVFCQYTVTNEPKDMMLTALPTGYRINLPQPKPDQGQDENQAVPDPRKLGDPKDGGSGWLLFKQFQTLKQQERDLSVLHYVELRDWEYYWDSVSEKPITMTDRTEETEPSACSQNPPTQPSPDSSASPS